MPGNTQTYGGASEWRRKLVSAARALCARLRRLLDVATDASRRELSLVLLYGCVAIPGLLSSYLVLAARSTTDSSHERRNLVFSERRAAGTLRLLDGWDCRRYRAPRPVPDSAWAYLAPARGRLQVHRDARVWLALSEAAFDHPEVLSRLHPDALYRISVEPGAPALDSGLAAAIGQLSGLRELDLRNGGLLPDGWSMLNLPPNLERLWLPLYEDGASQARALAWGARNGFRPASGGEDIALLIERPTSQNAVDK